MVRKVKKVPEKKVKIKKSTKFKLSAREENFCQNYLIDFNAGRSAREAGYSVSSCYEIGSKLLRNVKIQGRISELRIQLGKDFNATRERIAQEYARLGFFDIRDIYDEEGELIPVPQLPTDVAAAIAGVEVSNEWTKLPDGSHVITGQLKKVKIADKRAALDSLVKMMGYAAPEKKSFTDTEGNSVIPVINLHVIQPPKDEEDD